MDSQGTVFLTPFLLHERVWFSDGCAQDCLWPSHHPTCPSLSTNNRSSGSLSFVGSLTSCVWKLPSRLSRNLLDCFSLLYYISSRHLVIQSPPWEQGLVIVISGMWIPLQVIESNKYWRNEIQLWIVSQTNSSLWIALLISVTPIPTG